MKTQPLTFIIGYFIGIIIMSLIIAMIWGTKYLVGTGAITLLMIIVLISYNLGKNNKK